LLQHKIYQQADKVPEELKEIINEETYDKARVYGLDKSSFSIVKDLFGVTTSVVRHIPQQNYAGQTMMKLNGGLLV
jgi:STE24 endopeptidase